MVKLVIDVCVFFFVEVLLFFSLLVSLIDQNGSTTTFSVTSLSLLSGLSGCGRERIGDRHRRTLSLVKIRGPSPSHVVNTQQLELRCNNIVFHFVLV